MKNVRPKPLAHGHTPAHPLGVRGPPLPRERARLCLWDVALSPYFRVLCDLVCTQQQIITLSARHLRDRGVRLSGGALSGTSKLRLPEGRRQGRLDDAADALDQLALVHALHLLCADHWVHDELHAGLASVHEVLFLAGHHGVCALDGNRHHGHTRSPCHGEGPLLEVDQGAVRAPRALGEHEDRRPRLERVDAGAERLHLGPAVFPLNGDGLGGFHRLPDHGDLRDRSL
mmetsp:Transcript_56348/g.145053  ORF Transcript_56348/g.145053 Transcript_56348/m.145053 type:complete len:230 (-) Transcript_56348:641-1330(-)